MPATRTPRSWTGRTPTDLSGMRPNAAGTTIWGAETTLRGRVALTISAEPPTGDLVVATATFPEYETARAQLDTTLTRFERTTLANWDHPPGTRQSVRLIRGWFVSIGREPRRLPLIRLTRLTGGTRLNTGWTRFQIISVPSNH